MSEVEEKEQTGKAWKVENMSEKMLVSRMVAAKEKENKAKADYKKAATELQRRAMKEIVDHNVKFVRFHGAKGKVTVCKKGSLSLINGMAFKRVIGEELFNSEITTEQSIAYKLKAPFEAVLKAIFLQDYDFEMKLADVYDALGADTEQRSVLDKKRKGQYDKDCELLEAMFGEKNYETELYCIYKVKNAERIRIFFPDATEETLAEIRKQLLVEEGLSITLIK